MIGIIYYLLVGVGFGLITSWLASKEEPIPHDEKHSFMVMSMFFWPVALIYILTPRQK